MTSAAAFVVFSQAQKCGHRVVAASGPAIDEKDLGSASHLGIHLPLSSKLPSKQFLLHSYIEPSSQHVAARCQHPQAPPVRHWYPRLCHTCGDGEVTFDDIGKPHAEKMAGPKKISRCCVQAIKAGFEWVWIILVVSTRRVARSSQRRLTQCTGGTGMLQSAIATYQTVMSIKKRQMEMSNCKIIVAR